MVSLKSKDQIMSMLIFTGFNCEFCGKVFNRKARLQMHIRYVHEPDVRPFPCDECDKRFTRKEDLNRHSVLHTGSKMYQCPTCCELRAEFALFCVC